MTEDVRLPAPLNEDWDRETIVERFKTEFELDHRFMLSLHASLDQCREVYRRQHELVEKRMNSAIACSMERRCEQVATCRKS